MKNNPEKFDVAVIGGGPAGMLAAGRAAELGARVILLEKNPQLGRKLLLTGNGRCNLTNINDSQPEFIKKLGREGKFLFSALAGFGPNEVINFFKQRGLATKVEKNGRVFPMTDQAQDVRDCLLKYLQQNNVQVEVSIEASKFNLKNGKIQSVILKDREILADNFILTTGGKAYPATGSSGDGLAWATALGHQIVETRPALAPIKIQEPWVKGLQGISLSGAKITILQNDKKQKTFSGEIIFTHFGLSGPAIINASKTIGELLQKEKVEMEIDLLPEISPTELDKKLAQAFRDFSNKDLKNYLPELLPEKLSDVIIKLTSLEPKRKLNSTKEERLLLIKSIKNLRLNVAGLLGYEQAMVTAGGVALKEIDSKTMRSKIIPNLFFAGEILDLDGPTGGYNLQIAWSTGYAAGMYAAENSGNA